MALSTQNQFPNNSLLKLGVPSIALKTTATGQQFSSTFCIPETSSLWRGRLQVELVSDATNALAGFTADLEASIDGGNNFAKVGTGIFGAAGPTAPVFACQFGFATADADGICGSGCDCSGFGAGAQFRLNVTALTNFGNGTTLQLWVMVG